jgi:hypothetical protein
VRKGRVSLLGSTLGGVLGLQRLQPALRSGGHSDSVDGLGNSLVSELASRNRASFDGGCCPARIFNTQLQEVLNGDVLRFLYP